MATIPMYGRTAYLQTAASIGVDPFAYPGDEGSWSDWYQYRLDAYHGDTYSHAVVKAGQLFRALDDDGNVIAITRRLHRDVQHVVDVATAALAAGLVLGVSADAPDGLYKAARRIWRRGARTSVGKWARLLTAMGDYYLEPVRVGPGKARLVGYDARVVVSEYSTDGLERLERVTITHQFADTTTAVSADGKPVITNTTPHVYQRILTETEIIVTLDGELVEEQSGIHGLGVVPCVHLQSIPTSEPEHALWVGHGMDRAEAEVDSLMSMISAIGDRTGNPRLEIKGAKVADESKISRFGRILNFHGGSKDALAAAGARYIEPTLAGVAVLLSASEILLADVRASMPEFIFGNAGANASGDALRLRMDQYKAKYTEIRDRWQDGLSRALGMALAIEAGRPFDEEIADALAWDAPPLTPINVQDIIAAVVAADGLGAIRAVDVVRSLQKTGLVDPSVDPAEYVAQIIRDKEESEKTEAPPSAAVSSPASPIGEAMEE